MANRKTITAFSKMKRNNEKITMLTAYDYPTARIMDSCGIDGILVGDSLGMAVLGYEDTTGVTMEDMIHHIKAVARGAENTFIVGDMPFLSCNSGIEMAVCNAGRIIQEGRAQAVKLEGGREMVPEVRAIIRAGIPVMGHIGLTPQSINNIGGYFVRGKTIKEARKLLDDAKALEEAGAFAVVMECVPAELARLISSEISVPAIGIGAGADCDGQVLVSHDMLGFFQGKAHSFAKQYCNVSEIMEGAVSEYILQVKKGIFPGNEHSFNIDHGIIKKLEELNDGDIQ